MSRTKAWVTTKTAKIGRMAVTDSRTPRMLRTVSVRIAASSTVTLKRWTGSTHVPRSASASLSAAPPNHSRGTMLNRASPPAAMDVVIVRT